jgi:hypothetical protein
MGAFIQLKEPPKNKRTLLDIGIAGPIAGLVVCIPVLLYGLSLSQVKAVEMVADQGIQLEGNSLLYLLAKFVVFGQLLPAPPVTAACRRSYIGSAISSPASRCRWRHGCGSPVAGRVGLDCW